MKLVIINGPNLNMLGVREKCIYGYETYEKLVQKLNEYAKLNKIEIDVFQYNSEGDIISKLQDCYIQKVDGIILNAGAYTHYSYAIYDAIKSIDIDVLEVHISNIYARDEFRSKSVLAEVCIGQISGFGFNSYLMALDWFVKYK